MNGVLYAIEPAKLPSNIIVTDLTVSNKHLQIYSIAYTEDDHQRIFVYAKDISTNGSFWRYKYNDYWREYLIGKGRAVLLSDGDKLRLCDGSSFTFRPLHRNPECSKNASTVQEDDIKAGFSNLWVGSRLTCCSCSRTFIKSQTGYWDLERTERSGWLLTLFTSVKWLVKWLS